jgi:predicted DNA-binding transcriptional regulator
MTIEIRDRSTFKHINDLAGRTIVEKEVVFGFTIEELYALESWIPLHDGFKQEVLKAITELEIIKNK